MKTLTLSLLALLLFAATAAAQYVTAHVDDWERNMGGSYATEQINANEEIREYKTGDIVCKVRFVDNVAWTVVMDFSRFTFDGAVAGIQRDVINGTFKFLSQKLGDDAGLHGTDAEKGNATYFGIINTFGKCVAVIKATSKELRIDMTI